MPIFLATFQAVATLLGIGVLGFVILSRRTLPVPALRALNPLALDVALPALVFVTIVLNLDPQERGDWWVMPLWWAGFTVFALGASLAGAAAARRGRRREMAFTLFYQNATFFPLIVLMGLYGPDAPVLADLFLFNLFFAAMLFNTSHLFFKARRGPFRWGRTLNAVFVATMAAMAIQLLGWRDYVPDFVLEALGMVGAMATPLLMLIFGGNIYLDFSEKGPSYPLEAAKFVLLKNVAFPLATLGLLAWIRPAWGVGLILLLEAAAPPVASAPIFAEREGGSRHLCSQFVLASFLASLVSIPLAVWAFVRMFGAGPG